eukprot:10419727-Alexandrium_andersonii.AAC.1
MVIGQIDTCGVVPGRACTHTHTRAHVLQLAGCVLTTVVCASHLGLADPKGRHQACSRARANAPMHARMHTHPGVLRLDLSQACMHS